MKIIKPIEKNPLEEPRVPPVMRPKFEIIQTGDASSGKPPEKEATAKELPVAAPALSKQTVDALKNLGNLSEPVKPAAQPAPIEPPAPVASVPLVPPAPVVQPVPAPVLEDPLKKDFDALTSRLESALLSRADISRQELVAALKSLTTAETPAHATTAGASPSAQALWHNEMESLRTTLSSQMKALADQWTSARQQIAKATSQQDMTINQLSQDLSSYTKKLEQLRQEMSSLARPTEVPNNPAPVFSSEPVEPIKTPPPIEPAPIDMEQETPQDPVTTTWANAPGSPDIPNAIPEDPDVSTLDDFLMDSPRKSLFSRFWDYLNGTAVEIPIGRKP